MSTRTISLRLEAYDKLRRAKRPGESFSDVVMRARWAEDAITAAELLRRRREEGPALTAAELDSLDAVAAADQLPDDKWSAR